MAGRFRKPDPREVPLEKYRFVSVGQNPLRAIAKRVMLAIGLLLLVTMITYIGRDGYYDAHGDGPLTFIDALYYSTVTITTTGYGDIVPATQWSRLVTTVVITPLRVLFLILLVGTTLQVLADRSKLIIRRNRWERELKDHIVVCGFGIKGRSALEYLRNHNDDCQAVAIDKDEAALEAANALNVNGILGSAYDQDILKAADVKEASTVIIAMGSDEQSVLTVLRVNELAPKATIVVSCREEVNVELLKNSGADEVIVSSSSAGRILGMAAEAPEAARIINDLLTFGDGLDIEERVIKTHGEPIDADHSETAIAVVRGDTVMRPGDARCQPLEPNDKVIYIKAKEETIARAEAMT
ncbi:MAG: NAD-binding protein [Thermoleophilia bacterium]|nr:NAD-binding protein [Thermoleophilia bacterium]